VQPSRKVPISSWDYTNPSQMQHAYNLGRTDGEAFLQHMPQLSESMTHS
jgi:hypothetical protein